jgi:hypothetical protein
MKTDENYIYPESAEELAMFYGWECETYTRGIWEYGGLLNFWKCTSFQHPKAGMSSDYRTPLPTTQDLKVGDVVRYANVPNSVELWQARAQQFKDGCDITGVFGPISLLIGRNTWVPVKCD